ncbi:MAG: oxygen-independent coproporphyrinogen III oxidase [Bacteroidetes bacterium]|nr:oxygen-independent coproporphyrinogen III oxidase [Bacteroidota bacterium]
MDLSLINKYDRPAPRYTSYPTVPFWKEGVDESRWKRSVREKFAACNDSQGISLYVHLPFCESLCIYCGCNKRITTNHKVEEEYLDALFREWEIYLGLMGEAPVIRELHLGGGTPTFFSADNLERLVRGLLERSVVHPEHAFSIEGHPNNTTREHLERLAGLGFRRISYGVQDLNREVQERIHRIQPFENLARAVSDAREVGFTAINFDLIYGLPLQNVDRLRHSINGALSLRPDRLAFYSYAHTPWLNCSQKWINEQELPGAAEKLALYEQGKTWLSEAGYTNIGMDHFALETDELYAAWREGRLHRNFMGYMTQASGMLLGLGVSAISDSGDGYAQNDKALTDYYRAVREGRLAVKKGYFLSEEDRVFKRHILDIATTGRTVLDPVWVKAYSEWTIPQLRVLEEDGLVHVGEGSVVRLTKKGNTLLRHVCKAFDLHLLRDEKVRGNMEIGCGKPVFSRAI